MILFLEFLKVGLFTVGGGLASLPFLYNLIDKYNWFDENLMSDMIAISQSTPGPIGINMATFVGLNVEGIFGGILATLGFIMPSFVISSVIYLFLNKFKNNKNIEYIFKGIRPAVCTLISIALFEILKVSLFQKGKEILSISLFAMFFMLIKKYNKHPIIYIFLGAILGIFLKL